MFQDKEGGDPIKKMKNIPENSVKDRTTGRIRAKNVPI